MSRNRPTAIEPLTASVFLMVCAHAALAVGVWWMWQDHRASGGGAELTWMAPADFKNLVPMAYVPRAIPIAPAPVAATKPAPKAPAARRAAPKKVIEPEPVAKATLIAAPPQANVPQPVEGTPLFAGAAMTKTSANRSITLRRAAPKAPAPTTLPTNAPPAPPAKSASLADMVRLQTLRPAEPEPALPQPPDLTGVNMDAVDNTVNAVFYEHWIAPALDAVPESQRIAKFTISIARNGDIIASQMTQPSGSHALDNSILTAAAAIKKIGITLPSQFRKQSYDLDLTFHLLP